jgi:hypothetical protein
MKQFSPADSNKGTILLQEEVSPFRENNVVVFPFPFQIFMPLAKLWFKAFKDKLPS